jgi:hypothetical protein
VTVSVSPEPPAYSIEFIMDKTGVWLRCADITATNGLPGSRDIHISDCIFDKNYRQGMSIIGAVNMLVERSVFSNTNGTAPSAGVDVEPYLPTFEVTNVSFIDCQASNNSGPGFAFYISHFKSTTAPLAYCFPTTRLPLVTTLESPSTTLPLV